MKLIGILSLILLVLGGLVFLQYQKDSEIAESTISPFANIESEAVEIRITTDNFSTQLLKKDGMWWLQEPKVFLADQEFIEKNLQLMSQTPVDSQFVLEEDRFGFNPGRGFVQLVLESGEHLRLILGSEEAPNNRIFLLNKDSQQVSVVHNVWAQFFLYPPSRFFSQSLPIPGEQIRSVKLLVGEQVKWSLTSQSSEKVTVTWEGKTHEVEKSQLLWFFQSLGGTEIENVNSGILPQPPEFQLQIETENGNITFLFSEKEKKVAVPDWNAFADYRQFSLESLETELNKVIKSAKQ